MPDVDTGQPACSAICCAMLKPVAPSGFAQPMITSSTSPGSMPARSIAALTTCPPSVAPCVRLNAPRHDLVSAVRAVETMTASTTAFLLAGASLFRGPVLQRHEVLETAAARGKLCPQLCRFPEGRLRMRVRRELAHAPDDLLESRAARVEHRTAALQRESI